MTREDFEGRVLDAREKMYRVARSYHQGEQDCLDAVSEAVLRAWQKRSVPSPGGILRHVAHTHPDARMRQHPAQAKAHGARGERAGESRARRKCRGPARRAGRPAPKLRTVTVLHYMEGYDVSELSRLLRVPRGTVTSRLHMARGRLRELLKEDIE